MGFIISKQKNRRRFTSFVLDSFDVNPSTVARYLAEFDLSRQMLGSRPRPENVSFEQYAQEGYDYIVGLHNDGFFKHDPNLIWAVDFTARPSSSSATGRSAQKTENSKSIPRLHTCTRTTSLRQ